MAVCVWVGGLLLQAQWQSRELASLLSQAQPHWATKPPRPFGCSGDRHASNSLPPTTHPPPSPHPHPPQVQSYKRKIRQLEDDLLFRLSNSQGNLLDDTELIDILAVTKQTAQVSVGGVGGGWGVGGGGWGSG